MSVDERITLTQGDLTEMAVDAIVNAANNDLQLGGGVAGAIRRKGGPAIQQACNAHGPVAVGEAAITTGGHLKARYVIHAASMSLGSGTTEPNLRSSVRASLRLADEHHLETIAFPAVGAGIAGFPMRRCAQVMLEEAARHLDGETSLEEIRFVLYDAGAYQTFLEEYERM